VLLSTLLPVICVDCVQRVRWFLSTSDQIRPDVMASKN